MRKGIKSFLKYSISLAVAIFLFWYVYQDFDFPEFINRFKQVNQFWIYLSILMALLSHWIRAFRWNLLLKPIGYQLTTSRTFLAVMVGYLANFVVPRMGEVSRCGILKNTDNVPVAKGFGSVVTERLIDFICLLIIVGITFVIEFERISGFFVDLFLQKTDGIEGQYGTIIFIVILIIIVGVIMIILLKRNHERLTQNTFYNKVYSFLRQLIEGISSIRHLERPAMFWLSTVAIWVLYFLMTYVVIFSMEETASLPFSAGFTLLVLGGLGMAAPVQGGIGAFHYLVGAGLVLYGLPKSEGVFFAFLLHSSNSIAIMLVGLITFFISLVIPKRNAAINEGNSGKNI